MNKDLLAIFEYMEREKGIKREIIIQAVEEALRAAARKGMKETQELNIQIDPRTGSIGVFGNKIIVETVQSAEKEISLKEAQEINPDYELGQTIQVTITPKDFGRIAAQTARQIINQKLRGAERDVIYEEYRHRINEIVSGTVKRFIRGSDLVVDLGKVEAILPTRQYPKIERYHIGDRVMALLLEVQDTEGGGAEVILSRSHPKFAKQLFIQEVPELQDNTVVVEKIVREAGYRTKLSVRSTDSRVDPVGACVGMRGSRVKNIVRELNNEKVDIIPFSDDPIELLQNALAPVEIRKISINEEDRIVSIVVDDDDFPTVIGKKGMNARLNGALIDAQLDVQRISEYKKSMSIQRNELASSEDPSLDARLDLPTINKLILENLIDAGFDTPRKILLANPDKIAEVPGISIDMADEIIEQIRKKGANIE